MTTWSCTPGSRGDACGSGVCASDGASCACDAGFLWDMPDVVYRTCFVPYFLPSLLYGFTGVLSVVVMVWSAHVWWYLKPGTPVRRVMLWNTIGVLMSAALMRESL